MRQIHNYSAVSPATSYKLHMVVADANKMPVYNCFALGKYIYEGIFQMEPVPEIRIPK